MGKNLPLLDRQQNYELVLLTKADGQTVMKFQRSISACDEEDFPITVSKPQFYQTFLIMFPFCHFLIIISFCGDYCTETVRDKSWNLCLVGFGRYRLSGAFQSSRIGPYSSRPTASALVSAGLTVVIYCKGGGAKYLTVLRNLNRFKKNKLLVFGLNYISCVFGPVSQQSNRNNQEIFVPFIFFFKSKLISDYYVIYKSQNSHLCYFNYSPPDCNILRTVINSQ